MKVKMLRQRLREVLVPGVGLNMPTAPVDNPEVEVFIHIGDSNVYRITKITYGEMPRNADKSMSLGVCIVAEPWETR